MSRYRNPDAPDPIITQMVVDNMRRGGTTEFLPRATAPATVHVAYSQVHPEEAMWTTSLQQHVSNNSFQTLLSPREFISHYIGEKFKPRTVSRDEVTNIITVHERNGRDVDVGDFTIKDPLFVDPDEMLYFKYFYCIIGYGGKEYPIRIPFDSFVKRDILQYLWMLTRNPDCPEKYITIAFYLELQRLGNTRFLITPERSGWREDENGKPEFISRSSVHPHLSVCYPCDVRNRKLLETDRSLRNVAKDYADNLPASWKYKLLVALRLASISMFFWAKEGIRPDQLFAVEPSGESASKVAIALLKTQNYDSLVVLQLTSSKKALHTAARDMNDGIFVVRDSSLYEQWRKRNSCTQFLCEDLNGTDGNEERSRHITVVVCDNPGSLSEEEPIMYIDLSDQVCVGNPDELLHLSGEFDSAFVAATINDPVNMKSLFDDAIAFSRAEAETVVNSENINSKKLVMIGSYIAKEYRLINSDEFKEIMKWLRNGWESSKNSAVEIVNDFKKVFNRLIFKELSVVPQYGGYSYVSGKLMVIADNEYINFEAGNVDKLILYYMKTTKKRLKLLNALKSLKLLNSNNGLKRIIDLEISPGMTEQICVYSIPQRVLNSANMEKLDEMLKSNILFSRQEAARIKLLPMIMNRKGNLFAGKVLGKDENDHQYISGKSRSGKSKYLCEQAVEAAENGEQVLILDNNGSWTEQEIRKHLPDKIVDKYFSFWSIPKQGLPINLADLSNCETIPDKKQRIHSILAAGARSLGDTQDRLLKKKIKTMIKENESDVDIIDILNYFTKDENILTFQNTQFGEDQDEALLKDRLDCTEKLGEKGIGRILDYLSDDDKNELTLRIKFEDIFEDLEDLPKSSSDWGRFFSTQKKIVVVSTGTDGTAKGSHLIDMLLSSVYSYQQYHADKHITLVLDECEDLYLVKDAPIDIILRKGGKAGIRMLLASQEFSADKDRLGKIIGNCGTLVFFCPKTNSLSDIAKLTGIDKAVLASLEQGQCVVYGLLYDKTAESNKLTTIIGWTYKHNDK